MNPPLVRLVAAAPLAATGVELPPDPERRADPADRAEFRVGRYFTQLHGGDTFRYFILARWACLPFSLLGGYICFRWGCELYGSRSGLLALALWCFCPFILANAQMITPDIGAAACGMLAAYLFWRWFRCPNGQTAFLAGVGTGVALLCKTSWVLLFVLWPVAWSVLRLTQWSSMTRRAWAAQAVQMGLILLICLVVINTGYLWEDSFVRLGEYPFISEALTERNPSGEQSNRFADTWLGSAPVPLPRNFLLGIDVQRKDFESRFRSYLRGEFRREGWWYYYLYGLTVKWPFGTWILLLFALVSVGLIRHPQARWRDEVLVVLPGLTLVTLVSSQTGFNHHTRYILPALPFFYVWIGRIAEGSFLRTRLRTAVIVLGLGGAALSSLRVYPHSLSYFNELAGGPMNGSAHLIDSNVDWGQDLLFLKRWLNDHPEAQPIGLAYFGPVDPRIAGIDYVPPPKGVVDPDDLNQQDAASLGPQPGWYAVSVTLLRGYRYLIPDGRGGWVDLDQPYYTYFQRFRPEATAGYSIFIYHLEREECNRVRAEIGLPLLDEKS